MLNTSAWTGRLDPPPRVGDYGTRLPPVPQVQASSVRRPATAMRADPDAPDLAALIGELLLKSPDFARLWERYDVTRRTAAQNKTFHHPHIGTKIFSERSVVLISRALVRQSASPPVRPHGSYVAGRG